MKIELDNQSSDNLIIRTIFGGEIQLRYNVDRAALNRVAFNLSMQSL